MFMKHCKKVVVFLVLNLCLGTIVFTGCGGGGGSSSTTPIDTTTPQTSLNEIVRSPTSVNTTNLSTIASQFDQARKQSPTDLDAQTGFAISKAALASLTIANLNGVVVPSASKSNTVSTRIAGSVTLQQSLEIWKIGNIFTANSSPISPTDVIPNLLMPKTTISPVQLASELKTLDVSLAEAEAALTVVEQNPTYTYTLADPSNPSNKTATVKLGVAEFKTFHAVIATVRSIINASLAYNLDYTSFNYLAPATTVFVGHLTAGSTIPPSIYFPPSPFGTLQSDGKTRLATTKSELGIVFTDSVAAIENIKARSNSSYLLNPGIFIKMDQLNDIETKIQTYSGVLKGTQEIDFSRGKLKLNLLAILDNPPDDLKIYAPTIHVTDTGINNNSVMLMVDSFPDPTFGGVLPNGIKFHYNLPYMWKNLSLDDTKTTEIEIIDWFYRIDPVYQ